MNKRDLTVEMLYSKLVYRKTTGDFVWADNFGSRARKGEVAGSVRPDGYTHIGIFGFRYLLHHLIWLVETGKMPLVGIDHINRDKSDSRIVNLRAADQSENTSNKTIQCNNKCGVKGVSWSDRDQLWYVSAQFRGRRMRASCHSIEEAKQQYKLFSESLQGDFSLQVDKRLAA